MRKSIRQKSCPGILIRIFLVILACILVLIFMGSYYIKDMSFGTRVCSGGNLITENRSIQNVDTVALQSVGPFMGIVKGKLIITQGDQESLLIEGNGKLVRDIETPVREGTLYINYENSDCDVFQHATVVFHLTVRELEKLIISSWIPIEIQELQVDQLEIVHKDTGDITINGLIASNLVVKSSGSGDIFVSGQVDRQEITLTSLSNYLASDLESQNTFIRIVDMGGAMVWVHDDLEAVISGEGDIRYYGNPAVTQNITGEGILQPLGDR